MSHKSGISQVVLIISIGVIFIISITAVYLFFESNNSLHIPGLGTIGLSSRCKHTDPDLCKFLNRAEKADYFNGSFSGTSTLTDSSGKIFKSTWEMDGKKSSRVVNYEDNAEIFHLLILGNVSYVKDYTDGSWWKQEQTSTVKDPLSSLEAYNSEQYKKKAIEDIRKQAENSTFKQISTEPCGIYSCFKYEVSNADTIGRKEYIYFDSTHYILRKSRSEESNGAFSEMTYAYERISFKPPTPVKESKPGQNIFLNNGSDISDEKLDYIKEFENNMQKLGDETDSSNNQPIATTQSLSPTETMLPSGTVTSTPGIYQLQ